MPRPLIDLTGQRFGALTVRYVTTNKERSMWACVCDCGNSSVVMPFNLSSGKTTSCGCKQDRMRKNLWKLALPTRITHGHTRGGTITAEYAVWHGMVQRCVDPNTRGWKNYGGRGIGVCEHWRHSFEQFLTDMGKRPEGLTLERVDNNDGYVCPICRPPHGNCTWATKSEQIKNQRHEYFHEKRSRKKTEWWMSQSPEYRHMRASEAARARWGG
jgi:hypothetical protein